MKNKNNINLTNDNVDKSMEELLNVTFDSMNPEDLDDATLNAYLASTGATLGSKVRRATKRFAAVAACLTLMLGGGYLLKDKIISNNNTSTNGDSVSATNTDKDNNTISKEDDNKDTLSDNNTDNNDSPITEEFFAKREAAWEEFTKDKMKLIVMEGQVTELGIVGYRCMVAKDYDIARQGEVVDIRLETYVESYNGRIPYSANEAGKYEYCVVKPGSVIFVNIPETTDSVYPMYIQVSEESNPVYVLPDFNDYFVPSDLLYAPTTLEHLPASTFGLKGVNSYVNENELYKMLEVINSGEDTTYAFTIAEKDYSSIIGAYNKENINNPMYNLVNFMYDNNYGITTYYDILYSNDNFTIRIDSTEMNIFPELDTIHTPYTMNFYYMHVVEDYKGTGSKCIYFSNDETPMNGEELVQFLDIYNNPDDSEEYANITENYLVVMQSHLGVDGLRSGELDNNKDNEQATENNSTNEQETEDDTPLNVYMDWEAGLEYADNTNREIKENHLKEDANMDRIISVEEAIKTAEKLQGAVILHKDTRQVVFYDITLGYAYDIGDDYIKRNWNSKIVYKIKAACVGEGVFYETSFYVNAIKSKVIDNDKEDNSELGVTLRPDHSEYRSENELIKAINAGKREELKNLFHYYMPQSLPDNWYIDKILVTPELIKITYKYAKDNEVKNVGDYSFTWYLEQKTDQDESTYCIIDREDGLKDVTWYKDGYYFSATVPMDAGMDEIRGFATIRTEVIK